MTDYCSNLEYISNLLMEDDYMMSEDIDQLSLRDTEHSLYQVLVADQSLDQIPETSLAATLNENGSTSNVTGNMSDGLMLNNMFNDVESSSQYFKRGYEEARKFLPKIDLGSNNFASSINEHGIERDQPTDGSKGRKNRDREGRDLEEERRTKQLAIFVDESELHELFDKILLFDSRVETNKRPSAFKGEKSLTKQVKEEDQIDLKDLLNLCARAVFQSDHRTSSQLLKQIRAHASPFGDGSQRLAHYFASGLEARIRGPGTRIPNLRDTLASIRTTSVDVMKAIDCAFEGLQHELPIRYANKIICKMAENTKAIHIVDFGISFGFQWPNLIELLSVRDGGPPKLRFTGIEFPQQGFRPAGKIEETGNLLASYCKRFNVPFQFNCIAPHDWKTLQLEKLEIDSDEMVVANNLYRFESLLDETNDGVECPRDAVLRIIKSMNPDIFVHSVINGCLNGPFFLQRFREALFYYSSIFNELDMVVSPEGLPWLMYESHYYGPEIMNVVACEGSERIFRPESYKKWQVRNLRAWLKPIPLDQELMHGLRKQLKTQQHKYIALEEDGPWILQGWKGRITHAWSLWACATPHFCDQLSHIITHLES